MSKVSREKYEKIKDDFFILKEKYDSLYLLYNNNTDILEDKIYEYNKENNILSEENRNLRDKLRDTLENTVDTDLENDKHMKKTIKEIKKENKMILEKNEEKIRILERDILLKDGKIQRLEDGYSDMKERYKELKDEIREDKRWLKKKNDI